MDADGEFEQIYEYINGFAKCNGIQEIDSSTINFTPEINGVKVDLKKLNVYEVYMFQEAPDSPHFATHVKLPFGGSQSISFAS